MNAELLRRSSVDVPGPGLLMGASPSFLPVCAQPVLSPGVLF